MKIQKKLKKQTTNKKIAFEKVDERKLTRDKGQKMKRGATVRRQG